MTAATTLDQRRAGSQNISGAALPRGKLWMIAFADPDERLA